ncbi:unnamed protein product [Cuscuta campestris]|uniref:Uncharacterized protein n=1 Tax=Cuscuta campestris TaxID=132261 RepID=A0A484KV99_9ASTE|nr:unnamed protein product [Cuscuta campestris]
MRNMVHANPILRVFFRIGSPRLAVLNHLMALSKVVSWASIQSQCLMAPQICFDTQHPKKRWLMSSTPSPQSSHSIGRPRNSKLVLVGSLPLSTSHIVKEHLGGIRKCHMKAIQGLGLDLSLRKS